MKIKELRTVYHLSQTQLAALLQTSTTTISRYERGLIDPPQRHALTLDLLWQARRRCHRLNIPRLLFTQGPIRTLDSLHLTRQM